MLILATLAGCSTPPAAPIPEPPAPVAEPVQDEVAGIIGGEPILHRPVVMGGIATATVEAGIDPHRAEIETCYRTALVGDPGLSGKVAVRFKIVADGTVSEATTKSTSLRNAATEACVNAVVARARFPKLERGSLAIVTYPFSFGGG